MRRLLPIAFGEAPRNELNTPFLSAGSVLDLSMHSIPLVLLVNCSRTHLLSLVGVFVVYPFRLTIDFLKVSNMKELRGETNKYGPILVGHPD